MKFDFRLIYKNKDIGLVKVFDSVAYVDTPTDEPNQQIIFVFKTF